MDEKEIYAALGITPPEQGTTPPDSSEPSQEDGDPEQADGTPGENVSESDTSGTGKARPQGSGGAAQAAEDTEEDSEEPGAVPAVYGPEARFRTRAAGGGQTAEQKAGEPESPTDQEARWRALAQQEVRRAVEAEQARNQAEWSEFFASARLTDNLNGGKPITTLEEFRAWKAAYDRAKLEQSLKEGKLTPEALAYTIREAMNQQPQKETPLPVGGTGPSVAPPEVTKEQIDAELTEIHRLDGSVNGLEDILKLETGGAFQEAVRRGHSFLDAFKLANFDRLQERRQAEAAQAAQRAAQAARNSARSKEHLLPSGGKAGEGSVAVPGDVMEMYRMMMPGASEADIIAHYNRMQREMKT